MQRVTLDIQDSVYDHIMYLLQHLEKGRVKIVSKEEIDLEKRSLKDDLKNLITQNKMKAFKDLKDPVQWQREQRDEWR
jgi:hypothetical protein